MNFKTVKTWQQLLNDPRVKSNEIWSEFENDGKDYWVPLANGFNNDGCSIIHEWSKKACINKLNQVKVGNPY